MAKMQEITCKCGCGRKKEVRVSDIKRGWGQYFSKSCKAIAQERRTGQCAAYYHRQASGGRVPEGFTDAHLFSNEGDDF